MLQKLPVAKTSGQIRTFEMTPSVTGWLDGDINDWPAQIQDRIYDALEKLAAESECPVAIVFSMCRVDEDVIEGKPGRFFLHVVASEVVMADERQVRHLVRPNVWVN